MQFLSLLLLAHTFVLSSYASPVVSEQQVVLSGPNDHEIFEHENGESLPAEATEGWIDPRLNGGRFIDVSICTSLWTSILMFCNKYTTKKLGEPLNVIISSLSDPFILEEEGFRLYAKYVPRFLGIAY